MKRPVQMSETTEEPPPDPPVDPPVDPPPAPDPPPVEPPTPVETVNVVCGIPGGIRLSAGDAPTESVPGDGVQTAVTRTLWDAWYAIHADTDMVKSGAVRSY